MTTPTESDWQQDFDHFVHGRMAQIQAAANQWLVTMTSLLGLFSAAVVVGGSTTINSVDDIPRWVVIVLAAVVYLLALAAEREGVLATVGGLGVRPVSPAEREYAQCARALQHDIQDPVKRSGWEKQLSDAREAVANEERKRNAHWWNRFHHWLSDTWSPPPLIGGRTRSGIATNQGPTSCVRIYTALACMAL